MTVQDVRDRVASIQARIANGFPDEARDMQVQLYQAVLEVIAGEPNQSTRHEMARLTLTSWYA